MSSAKVADIAPDRAMRRADMVNAGATFVDEEVVREGDLITSRKPDDLPALCRSIIEALAVTRPEGKGS